jgi:hypothetical protein
VPAGCVAEEITALRLIETASGWLGMRGESGELSASEASSAEQGLRDTSSSSRTMMC